MRSGLSDKFLPTGVMALVAVEVVCGWTPCHAAGRMERDRSKLESRFDRVFFGPELAWSIDDPRSLTRVNRWLGEVVKWLHATGVGISEETLVGLVRGKKRIPGVEGGIIVDNDIHLNFESRRVPADRTIRYQPWIGVKRRDGPADAPKGD
jgi:hypothetical protein